MLGAFLILPFARHNLRIDLGESVPEMWMFVYGSLAEGFVHFQKIQQFVRHSEQGSIKGSAHRLRVGYPVVLENGVDLVPGQLVRVESTPLLLELLDRFHGVNSQDPDSGLFYRQEVSVYSQDPLVPPRRAWTYFLNRRKLPADAQEICGGDWMTVLRERPALTGTLTERQKQYILRLGSSTGREIIPIDLPLYRELMNLEIIVDKGRRLALTKLGHEVYRYLG